MKLLLISVFTIGVATDAQAQTSDALVDRGRAVELPPYSARGSSCD